MTTPGRCRVRRTVDGDLEILQADKHVWISGSLLKTLATPSADDSVRYQHNVLTIRATNGLVRYRVAVEPHHLEDVYAAERIDDEDDDDAA